MKLIGLIASALFALALSACATNEFSDTRTTPGFQSVRGSPIYIYSFLDVREQYFGPTMLTTFDRMLQDQLAAKGVKSELLRFKESEPAMEFILSDATARLPVGDVVASNKSAESALNARYRLVIFPVAFTQATTQTYQINWMLIDVDTGRTVWRTTSSGVRTIWASHDEDAENRAKLIVDGIIAEMSGSGLF
ncbi:hypothetical protein [Brevundimonas lenta]|uniref:DUF4136 domain-containing protein n=1 Tax=Brevundimonas lenta TaxID=424796 RepID=A0A7W6NR89_9CAUL|nr:hypothetical protein [Brevundimonas lenta]MBB4083915.1 hypothetical protein [Brevundimonas lenta]